MRHTWLGGIAAAMKPFQATGARWNLSTTLKFVLLCISGIIIGQSASAQWVGTPWWPGHTTVTPNSLGRALADIGLAPEEREPYLLLFQAKLDEIAHLREQWDRVDQAHRDVLRAMAEQENGWSDPVLIADDVRYSEEQIHLVETIWKQGEQLLEEVSRALPSEFAANWNAARREHRRMRLWRGLLYYAAERVNLLQLVKDMELRLHAPDEAELEAAILQYEMDLDRVLIRKEQATFAHTKLTRQTEILRRKGVKSPLQIALENSMHLPIEEIMAMNEAVIRADLSERIELERPIRRIAREGAELSRISAVRFAGLVDPDIGHAFLKEFRRWMHPELFVPEGSRYLPAAHRCFELVNTMELDEQRWEGVRNLESTYRFSFDQNAEQLALLLDQSEEEWDKVLLNGEPLERQQRRALLLEARQRLMDATIESVRSLLTLEQRTQLDRTREK